jgi:hypothetical protein
MADQNFSGKMKPVFFFGLVALLVLGCSTAKNTPKTPAVLANHGSDTTEYELVVTDLRFDHWYLVNYSEAKDRSNEYYRGQNQVAAARWNDYFRSGRYDRVIDSELNYLPGTDYGKEVNRKLYWYFRYVEEQYGIRLFL